MNLTEELNKIAESRTINSVEKLKQLFKEWASEMLTNTSVTVTNLTDEEKILKAEGGFQVKRQIREQIEEATK